MKKISTVAGNGEQIFKGSKLTIGLDLGDRWSFYCVLDEAGEVILEQKLPTTPEAMKQHLEKMPRSRIALETGTHSPWVSRLLTELGHEVIVAHAQNVQLITKSSRKDDRHDARTLARLARIDPAAVGAGAASQRASTNPSDRDPGAGRTGECSNGFDQCSTRIGEVVWRTTAQVWHAAGEPGAGRCIEHGLARGPGAAVEGSRIAERAHRGIRPTDRDKSPKKCIREVALLKQVKGVGTQIALTYVLTIEDPYRFREESRGGLFSGVATRPQELWAERTTEAHQQRRRPVSAHDDGAGSALHSGTVWRRQ